MMFGIRHSLMDGDNGGGGGGGGGQSTGGRGRGGFGAGNRSRAQAADLASRQDGGRNKDVVRVTERSFQSPGTTGGAIDTGKDTFFRTISPGSQRFAQGAAQLTGALSGIPGLGTFLSSQVKPVIETDQFGVRLPGIPRPTSDSDRSGESFGQFASRPGAERFSGVSSFGGGGVASAADIAIQRALGLTETAAAGATQRLEEGREAALGFISPFAEAGTGALAQQQAFLGLSGPEAQAAALAGFTGGPEAQFAQNEEEQAIIRNALAIGDVGGGRTRDALGSRAQGRFSTRLDTRLAQLGQISGQGQQAAFGQSNIQQNTAANLSNLLLGTGEAQSSAVLGQEVARAGAASEANRIAALQQQQRSQQDAQRQSQLFGLAGSIAGPLISSFF